MKLTARRSVAFGAVLMVSTAACDFDSQLAPRVELDVVVDGTGMRPQTTDLGYRIELTRCRVAIDSIEFTTDGEMHARAPRSGLKALHDWIIPTAHAHPGHDAGGEIVGELPGRFVFDWRDDGAKLGVATMLVATYSGANFTFAMAESEDGLAPDDPIVGHTFDIAGVATLDGEAVTFEVVLDQDAGRRIIGLPLDLVVDEGTDATVGLRLNIVEPSGVDTIFDGLDFAALDDDGDGHVSLSPETEAYNRLRRSLQVHDHYEAGVAE